jgi:hypothetical protein
MYGPILPKYNFCNILHHITYCISYYVCTVRFSDTSACSSCYRVYIHTGRILKILFLLSGRSLRHIRVARFLFLHCTKWVKIYYITTKSLLNSHKNLTNCHKIFFKVHNNLSNSHKSYQISVK